MNTVELLADVHSRIRETVHEAVDGLTAEELAERPDRGGNSVAWLLWHLARIQDDHIAEVAGHEPIWTSAGWHERFGLPFPASATGFGQSPTQVAKVRVSDGALLTGYYDAVHEAAVDYLTGLGEADLDRIVDERWDPPVTLGVRMISLIVDDIQHAGQAAYLRGILMRRR